MSYKYRHRNAKPVDDTPKPYFLVYTKDLVSGDCNPQFSKIMKVMLTGDCNPEFRSWRLLLAFTGEINHASNDLLPHLTKIHKRVWRTERFDNSLNKWIEVPPFEWLECSVEISIPSTLEGIKIAPKNTSLIFRMVLDLLKKGQIAPLTPEEEVNNRNEWFGETTKNQHLVIARFPETTWVAYWEKYGKGDLFWFNPETGEGTCVLPKSSPLEPESFENVSDYSVIASCGYIPREATEAVIQEISAMYLA